jgi:hypothetical protein
LVTLVQIGVPGALHHASVWIAIIRQWVSVCAVLVLAWLLREDAPGVVLTGVLGTQVAVVTYDVHAQVFSANALDADAAAAFVRARLVMQVLMHTPAVVVAAVVARAWVAVFARDALAEVLSAHAVNADVTRTAGGSIADWVVVTLITGIRAGRPHNIDTVVYGAWVAVTTIPAWTRLAAAHEPRRPKREQKQHKADQPTHKPPPRFTKRS